MRYMKFQMYKLRIIETPNEVAYVMIPPHASLYVSKWMIAHIK